MSLDSLRKTGRHMTAAIVQAIARASPGNLVLSAISVLAGAALCGLGIGQTVAAFLELRAVAVEARAGDGTASSPQTARATIGRFEQADFWWSDPSNSLKEGALLMQLARPAAGGPYDRDLLKEAEARFARSLAGNPADATAWAALANARLLDQGPSPDAADALALSMELARFEPSLLAWRCEMGLAMLDVLDAGRKAALADQIRMLERHSGSDLARIARASGRIAVVIAALGNDNDALRRFQDSLRYVK